MRNAKLIDDRGVTEKTDFVGIAVITFNIIIIIVLTILGALVILNS